MPLVEMVLAAFGTAVGVGSGLKDLKDVLSDGVHLEKVVTDLVEEGFQQHLPRLEHLCPSGSPVFIKNDFKGALETEQIEVTGSDDFVRGLLPILRVYVLMPGATCSESDYIPIFESILRSAIRGMWKRIATYESLSNEL